MKFELHDESKQWKDGITLSSDKVINTLLFCYIGLQYNIPDHSGHPRATSEYKCHCLVFILGLFCLVFSRKMRVNFHPNGFSLLLVWILTGIGELQVYFQFFVDFMVKYCMIYPVYGLWFQNPLSFAYSYNFFLLYIGSYVSFQIVSTTHVLNYDWHFIVRLSTYNKHVLFLFIGGQAFISKTWFPTTMFNLFYVMWNLEIV